MNNNPILPCEPCERATMHTFMSEGPTVVKSHTGREQTGYEQIFQCGRCDSVRRYGFTCQAVEFPV